MEKSVVPALSNGLDIIDLISEKERMSFNELKEKLGKSSSSLSRLLRVLMEYGYIRKNSYGEYTLGYKPFLIHSQFIWETLLEDVKPVLKEISEQLEMTILFFKLDEEVICLTKYTAQHNIAMQEPGKIYAHNSISPWGILALIQKSEQEKDRVYEYICQNSFFGKPHMSKGDFHDKIYQADRNGYDIDYTEKELGIYRVAVPIKNRKGQIFASLSAGSHSRVFDKWGQEYIINVLKEKAEIIGI